MHLRQLSRAIAIVCTCLAPCVAGEPDGNVPQQSIVVVQGATGDDAYQDDFENAVEAWRVAAAAAKANYRVIGQDDASSSDLNRLADALAEQATSAGDRLWLILIGHGTFDGERAKFNLRGPDLTAEQLAEWLGSIETPTVVVNCASSSGPFINALSADGRVVITATKSGFELNYTRFGRYFATAIFDRAADLDKDDQVSLLEAFLTACRQVEEFYEADNRLASEHALLDDNGDGLGTPATWFRGIRASKRAKEGAELDGLRAHQVHLIASGREARMSLEARKRRDAIELQVAALRERKDDLSEEQYIDQLEPLMLKLAHLYQDAATSDAAEVTDAVDEASDREVSSTVLEDNSGDTDASDDSE